MTVCVGVTPQALYSSALSFLPKALAIQLLQILELPSLFS